MEQTQNIGSFLINAGIRPSFQRIKIYEYLIIRKNHPTVEMIYKDLNSYIPTLSKTTVYNTLKLFVDKGITQIITIEDNETRYDPDISTHGHFKCTNCGKIFDFSFDNKNLNIKQIENFEIKQTHLYIKGICENCKRKIIIK
ncbi:MAG: transcriptional repressor [Bacteroidetes bacterium]|nr:transcriptional repressor [Bacteroidota bacterium]